MTHKEKIAFVDNCVALIGFLVFGFSIYIKLYSVTIVSATAFIAWFVISQYNLIKKVQVMK